MLSRRRDAGMDSCCWWLGGASRGGSMPAGCMLLVFSFNKYQSCLAFVRYTTRACREHIPTIAYLSPSSNSSSFSFTACSRAFRSFSESPLPTNPMNATSNPSAWNRCVMYGSKSAVSDIKRRRRGADSSAGDRRSRFAELALRVRFSVSVSP